VTLRNFQLVETLSGLMFMYEYFNGHGSNITVIRYIKDPKSYIRFMLFAQRMFLYSFRL
jgi:hypothetical protein